MTRTPAPCTCSAGPCRKAGRAARPPGPGENRSEGWRAGGLSGRWMVQMVRTPCAALSGEPPDGARLPAGPQVAPAQLMASGFRGPEGFELPQTAWQPHREHHLSARWGWVWRPFQGRWPTRRWEAGRGTYTLTPACELPPTLLRSPALGTPTPDPAALGFVMSSSRTSSSMPSSLKEGQLRHPPAQLICPHPPCPRMTLKVRCYVRNSPKKLCPPLGADCIIPQMKEGGEKVG